MFNNKSDTVLIEDSITDNFTMVKIMKPENTKSVLVCRFIQEMILLISFLVFTVCNIINLLNNLSKNLGSKLQASLMLSVFICIGLSLFNQIVGNSYITAKILSIDLQDNDEANKYKTYILSGYNSTYLTVFNLIMLFVIFILVLIMMIFNLLVDSKKYSLNVLFFE